MWATFSDLNYSILNALLKVRHKKNILCMHNFIASFFFNNIEFNIFAEQFFNKRVFFIHYRKTNFAFIEEKLTNEK